MFTISVSGIYLEVITPQFGNSRLGSVEFCLCHTSKLLAADVADHGFCYFTIFKGFGFDGGICVGGCGCGGVGGGDFFDGFVLVGFEPF